MGQYNNATNTTVLKYTDLETTVDPHVKPFPWEFTIDNAAKRLASGLEIRRRELGYPRKNSSPAVQYYLIGVGYQGDKIAGLVARYLKQIMQGGRGKNEVVYLGACFPKRQTYISLPRRSEMGNNPIFVVIDDNYRPGSALVTNGKRNTSRSESGLQLAYDWMSSRVSELKIGDVPKLMLSVVGGGYIETEGGVGEPSLYHVTLATPPDMVPMFNYIWEKHTEGYPINRFRRDDFHLNSPIIFAYGLSGSYWGTKLAKDLLRRKRKEGKGTTLLGNAIIVSLDLMPLRGYDSAVPVVMGIGYVDERIQKKYGDALEGFLGGSVLGYDDILRHPLNLDTVRKWPSLQHGKPLGFDDVMVSGGTMASGYKSLSVGDIEFQPAIICRFDGFEPFKGSTDEIAFLNTVLAAITITKNNTR